MSPNGISSSFLTMLCNCSCSCSRLPGAVGSTSGLAFGSNFTGGVFLMKSSTT